MSTAQVSGPVICGRIGPAGVEIAKTSESVKPRWRRYMIASRAPFPDSSASDPSGLKIRRSATNSGSAGGESRRIPSAPTPVCGSQIRLIRPGVRANGRSPSSMIR